MRWNDRRTGRAYSFQRVFTEHLDEVKRRLRNRELRFRERLENSDAVRVISCPQLQIRTAFGTKIIFDARVLKRFQ